jgi:uncharacterized membrane protein
MYCLNCGKKLDDGQLICPNCGQQIDPAVQESVIRHINEKKDASNESSSMYDPGQSQYIPQGINAAPGNNMSQGINAAPGNNMSQGINAVPGNNIPQGINAGPDDGSCGKSKKTADLMCLISICMMFLPLIVFFLWSLFFEGSFLDNIVMDILGILPLAAIVLMVIVRIKYPKNTFGKVLMWLYIVLVAIAALLVVACIAFCFYLIESCKGL